jgi:hypothetical protein
VPHSLHSTKPLKFATNLASNRAPHPKRAIQVEHVLLRCLGLDLFVALGHNARAGSVRIRAIAALLHAAVRVKPAALVPVPIVPMAPMLRAPVSTALSSSTGGLERSA